MCVVSRSQPPREALEGADAVVNLAGEPVAQRWTTAARKQIFDSRVNGTRELVRAISQMGRKPATLISMSAVGYYGDRGEEELSESSPPGTDFLAGVCQAWEAEALRAEEDGVRVVCLRLGVVIGPGGGALSKMLPAFRLGLGGPLGTGRQWMPWVDIADVAGLVSFALANGSLRGPMNTVSPHPVRNADFTAALGRSLRRPAILRVPSFALQLALGEMSGMLLWGQKVFPQAASQAGYEFLVPSVETSLRRLSEIH